MGQLETARESGANQTRLSGYGQVDRALLAELARGFLALDLANDNFSPRSKNFKYSETF